MTHCKKLKFVFYRVSCAKKQRQRPVPPHSGGFHPADLGKDAYHFRYKITNFTFLFQCINTTEIIPFLTTGNIPEADTLNKVFTERPKANEKQFANFISALKEMKVALEDPDTNLLFDSYITFLKVSEIEGFFSKRLCD